MFLMKIEKKIVIEYEILWSAHVNCKSLYKCGDNKKNGRDKGSHCIKLKNTQWQLNLIVHHEWPLFSVGYAPAPTARFPTPRTGGKTPHRGGIQCQGQYIEAVPS